jgi:hypothetical protein
MYRNKILIEEVGLRLNEASRLEFCAYDAGFAMTSLVVEFDAIPSGKGEDGRQEFEMCIVSTAWFLAASNAQHFNSFDYLHAAASAYALTHERERMLELATASHEDAADNPHEFAMAA